MKPGQPYVNQSEKGNKRASGQQWNWISTKQKENTITSQWGLHMMVDKKTVHCTPENSEGTHMRYTRDNLQTIYAAVSGSTATTCRFRCLFQANRTLPSLSAYNVWSLPCPTPSPGLNFRPLWRMIIVPAVTPWPPNRFTPSLLPMESLPLPELPPAFFVADRNCTVQGKDDDPAPNTRLGRGANWFVYIFAMHRHPMTIITHYKTKCATLSM